MTDPLDLRYELHEPMHVYNHYFFADSLPSWLDEGFAIQAEVHVVCGGDPRLMTGPGTAGSAGDTDGHTVGSEFFKRLEAEHGCAADCAAEAWRDLVDAHGADRYLTNAEIKAVFESPGRRGPLAALHDARHGLPAQLVPPLERAGRGAGRVVLHDGRDGREPARTPTPP